YFRFVNAVAARYRGKVPAYEVWNEPDGRGGFFRGGCNDLARMIKLAYCAIKQADQIKQKADAIRSQLNTEMSSLFEKIDGMVITFASKAGETGKLYGSITPQMIVDAINEKSGASIEKRQLEVEPIRTLGEHHVTVRLTVDIVPTVKVIVHREGEKVNLESLVTEEPEKAE
ncbi:MAG TPA: 50S ribosomal protein L9, partial [Flexilinea sp.]|nr:50S ribosomal protein L9 [Flexilinea sp.]